MWAGHGVITWPGLWPGLRLRISSILTGLPGPRQAEMNKHPVLDFFSYGKAPSNFGKDITMKLTVPEIVTAACQSNFFGMALQSQVLLIICQITVSHLSLTLAFT